MNYPNEALNQAIVLLRKANEKVYSYAVLAKLLSKKREFVHMVYHRDKNKYNLPAAKGSK